jgi:hypothetical protein
MMTNVVHLYLLVYNEDDDEAAGFLPFCSEVGFCRWHRR